MLRASTSHKGENGTVAIIGGSRHQHGAALFSALAAEASGVDLLYVVLPRCHSEAAKQQSLNFQVHPFRGDDITDDDVEPILELLATMDCAVVGPGLARGDRHLRIIEQLIGGSPCPLVLDASALQPFTLSRAAGHPHILTPHRGELERMRIAPEDLGTAAKHHQLTILLKGPVDAVAAPQGTVERIAGGNAGLTVGGSGDALAGLICGLIAQGIDHQKACVKASTVIERVGTLLFAQRGYAYRTIDVIGCIPHVLKTYEVTASEV